MNRLAILVGVTAVMALGTLKTRDAHAQVGLWIPPACKLNTKHFLVNSAQLYLKNAVQAKSPDQRATNLRDASRVLNQGLAEGQAENPAVWYFLGRYYLLTEDMAGADSAFTRAVKGEADCKDDVDTYRRQAWVPEIQAAADALNKNDLETAKVHFRKGNAIYREDPLGFYYLANVFTNQGNLDSAIIYYHRTVDLIQPIVEASRAAAAQPKPVNAKGAPATSQPAVDSSAVETYETSVFNLARLYHQLQKWDSSAIWYQRYRQEKPGDMQALAGLAVVYQESGDSVRAAKLYDEMLAKADQVPLLDLFGAGISLFKSGQYQRAADAFQAVLKKSPYYRDALYNLASTYLSMSSTKDTTIPQAQREATTKQVGEKMLPIARRMVEVDSYNRNSLRMLAMAYQFAGMQDSILAALTRAEDLPYEVNVTTFQEVENGHQVRGTITAFEPPALKAARDSVKWAADSIPKLSATLADVKKAATTGKDPKTGKLYPPDVKVALQKRVPIIEKQLADLQGQQQALARRTEDLKNQSVRIAPISFEFLSQSGQVVASQTIPESAVAANGSKDFELTAVGQGITGWRYKVGG